MRKFTTDRQTQSRTPFDLFDPVILDKRLKNRFNHMRFDAITCVDDRKMNFLLLCILLHPEGDASIFGKLDSVA